MWQELSLPSTSRAYATYTFVPRDNCSNLLYLLPTILIFIVDSGDMARIIDERIVQ